MLRQVELINTLVDSPKRIEVLAYCLLPNHFHLVIRQEKDEGISGCLTNVLNSYVHTVNTLTGRSGPLFGSRFKAKRIQTQEQLLHLIRYIHLIWVSA